jgi:DNA polymerase I
MVKKNISPETVCCNCCDNDRTPELDFSICEKRKGFIGKVLKPLIEDRQEMKEKVDEIVDEDRRRYVQGSIDAIKWILVSCFGYMGHSHASYGAIKCHQAIQAYDRDIMIKTKETFENRGYKVSHGIIDSIWVQQKKETDTEDFEQVCREISEKIGIKLEPEHRFEWVAFVPRTSSQADIGTLNRYFGKKQSGEFKTAGIETEQRSTCQFIKKSQMEMIKALDRNMKPEDVIKTLENKINKLKTGQVDTGNLVKKRKVSKTLQDYSCNNISVACLKRAKRKNLNMKPGQSLKFIVADDEKKGVDRVRLGFENKEKFDEKYYIQELIRAAETVLSPLGFDRKQIKQRIQKSAKTKLQAYN